MTTTLFVVLCHFELYNALLQIYSASKICNKTITTKIAAAAATKTISAQQSNNGKCHTVAATTAETAHCQQRQCKLLATTTRTTPKIMQETFSQRLLLLSLH